MLKKCVLMLMLGVMFGFRNTIVQAQEPITSVITEENLDQVSRLVAVPSFRVYVEFYRPPGPQRYGNAYYEYEKWLTTAPRLVTFSPDERYLAMVTQTAPFILRLIDLEAETEQYFLLDNRGTRISPDWYSLIVLEPGIRRGSVETHLWDLSALLDTLERPLNAGYEGTCIYRTTIGSTNLRAEANFDSEAVGYALEGEVYEIVAMNFQHDWVEVRHDGKNVWLSAQFGMLEGQCAGMPIYLPRGGGFKTLEFNTFRGYGSSLPAFSPDGRFIFDRENSWSAIDVYDTHTGELKYQVPSSSFQFSDDNTLIFDAGGRIYDADDGRLIFHPPLNTLSKFSLNMDRRILAAIDSSGSIRIYDLASGSETHSMELPVDEKTNLEFGAGGTTLFIRDAATGGWNSIIWNLNDPQSHIRFGEDTEAYLFYEYQADPYARYYPSVEANSVYKYVWINNESPVDAFEIWDVFPSQFRFRLEARGIYGNPVFSETGRALLIGESSLNFVSLQTGEMLASRNGIPTKFSPGRRWLYELPYDVGTMWLWGVAKDPSMPTLPPPLPTATNTPTPTWTPLPPGVLPTVTPTNTVTPTDRMTPTLMPTLTPTP